MQMSSSEVWFSHREKIFKINKGKIEWMDEKKIWTWDRCTISLADIPTSSEGISTKKLRVIVRSSTNQNQTSINVNRPITLRFMLGFDIEKVGKVQADTPTGDMRYNRDSEIWTGPEERWLFQLDDDYWIWDFKKKDDESPSSNKKTVSNVHEIHEKISKRLSEPPSSNPKRIFELDEDKGSYEYVIRDFRKLRRGQQDIVPVIYHPAVDGLKNFIREVHCHQVDKDASNSVVEVTLIFNGEQLRKNWFADKTYKIIRSQLYNRTEDVETFKIKINRDDPEKNRFIFKNIYSTMDGVPHGLNYDSIHGDSDGPRVEHEISYYFYDYSHPIVFVNTSNHAMAEHDANRTLWKWEYLPGAIDSPVHLGRKSRNEIDKEYKHFGKLHKD